MRLNNLNVVMDSSSKWFATVEVDIYGTGSWISGILVQETTYPYLYTNDCRINGRRNDFKDALGYRYSFVLTERGEGDTIKEKFLKEFAVFNDYYDARIRVTNRTLTEKESEALDSIGLLSGVCDECEEQSGEPESAEDEMIWKHPHYTNTMYHGMHGYHHHHDSELNAPVYGRYKYRIGIELEVEFNCVGDLDDFTDTGSNWFVRERDGSLNSYGCEIITIPLLPSDAKSVDFWKPLTNHLTGKATSWDNGRCGLHVHIGREILGSTDEKQSETLGRLLYMYHHYIKDTRLNSKIFGRERGYNDCDCKTPVGDAVKTLGKEVLKHKNIKEKLKSAAIHKAQETRYFDINLRNEHTIEFRRGKGSLNPRRIAMVVEYCEKLCSYASITPWQQIDYSDVVNYLKATASPMLKSVVESYC